MSPVPRLRPDRVPHHWGCRGTPVTGTTHSEGLIFAKCFVRATVLVACFTVQHIFGEAQEQASRAIGAKSNRIHAVNRAQDALQRAYYGCLGLYSRPLLRGPVELRSPPERERRGIGGVMSRWAGRLGDRPGLRSRDQGRSRGPAAHRPRGIGRGGNRTVRTARSRRVAPRRYPARP